MDIKFTIPQSLEELKHFTTDLPTFSDIETEGLYTNTRLIQLYQPIDLSSTDSGEQIQDVYILDTDIIPLQDIKDFIKPLWTVWYNASYDFGTLNMTTDKFDDLFYLVRTAYPEFQEYSLDKTVDNMGLGRLYEGLDKKSLQKQGFVKGAYLSQAQLRYSAIDVYALSLIWKNQNIQNGRDIIAYKVDILSMKYAIQYQQNGLIVDTETRDKKMIECQLRVDELRPEFPEGFNPNSYKQVRAYLGIDKSDYDTLVKYAASDNPLADKAGKLISLKKSLKEISYLNSIQFPIMYTKFNVAGAITGRFTSSGGDLPNGFNAQQIPRAFQPLFKHDTEDTVVVGLDYSTLELRIAAAIFGEVNMYNELMKGEDLHTNMAILSTGKTLHPDGIKGSDYDTIKTGSADHGKWITKTDRTLAKAINFGYVFGMSAGTYQNYSYVSYGIKCTLEEAERLRNTYFNKYPFIKKYHQYVWNNYKKPSFTYQTALGRRVKPRLGTDGINGPVQGSGGETTKLAVHYLIKEHPEALKFIYNVVHDAIYLRVPKEDEAMWTERLRFAMVKGWEEISKTPLFKYKDIPMPVEV